MNAKVANRTFDTVNIIFLFLFLVLSLVPFLHIIAISLSSNAPIMTGIVSIFPVDVSFEAYSRVLKDPMMLKSLWFSIYLTAYLHRLLHGYDDLSRLPANENGAERP